MKWSAVYYHLQYQFFGRCSDAEVNEINLTEQSHYVKYTKTQWITLHRYFFPFFFPHMKNIYPNSMSRFILLFSGSSDFFFPQPCISLETHLWPLTCLTRILSYSSFSPHSNKSSLFCYPFSIVIFLQSIDSLHWAYCFVRDWDNVITNVLLDENPVCGPSLVGFR